MSKSGSRYGRRSNWFKIHCLLQEQQQAAAAAAANGSKKPVPTNSLSMLGHPSQYPPGMYHRPPCTKEELMLLGLEEYAKMPLPSPSVSSPESHNSDSSVDVGDRRNSMPRHGPKFPDHHQFNKELFLRLPFAGLPSLPFMHQSSFMPPSHLLFPGYHPALFPHHHELMKPSPESPHFNPLLLANNNNNNCNGAFQMDSQDKRAEELTKRFYLDAVLHSQRHEHTESLKGSEEDEEDIDENPSVVDETEKVIAMTPPQSPPCRRSPPQSPPCRRSPTPPPPTRHHVVKIAQDIPIDLSVKSESTKSEDGGRRSNSPRSTSDILDNIESCSRSLEKRNMKALGGGYDSDNEHHHMQKKLKCNGTVTIPLDLTTKV